MDLLVFGWWLCVLGGWALCRFSGLGGKWVVRFWCSVVLDCIVCGGWVGLGSGWLFMFAWG